MKLTDIFLMDTRLFNTLKFDININNYSIHLKIILNYIYKYVVL